MKRPTEEIEKLREVLIPGRIDPTKVYQFDVGGGEILSYTGEELLETAKATIAFADAEKRGDKVAMLEAMKILGL